MKRSFASDNNSGVHPIVLAAINAANSGHVVAYGDDPYTDAALARFREHFGDNVDVYFVFGGTGANVLALQTMTDSYHAIICAEKAHINVDECGAPERFTGCKLLPVKTTNGKISPTALAPLLHGLDGEHHVQRRVISISQSTEMGTVYTAAEIKELAEFSHKNGMLLHMDGARIANAAVTLGAQLREITTDVGVDALSFGGTKNGMMYGEAVVLSNADRSGDFKFIRKQGAQLPSKMRFIAAQFEALLSNNLWHENAEQANRMARRLADELQKIQIKPTQEVQANAVFVRLPKETAERLRQKYFFYDWDEETSEVRFMTSFDTTEQDVNDFVEFVHQILRR